MMSYKRRVKITTIESRNKENTVVKCYNKKGNYDLNKKHIEEIASQI